MSTEPAALPGIRAGGAATQPAAAARARLWPRISFVVLPALTALGALAAWEGFCRLSGVHPVVLPPPSLVLERFFRFLPLIAGHAVPTTLESLGAFFLACVLGCGLAMLVVLSRGLREALWPNLVFFQLIPKIALAPLFIVWLGIGSESRLTFALFVTFFPMLVATVTGLEHVGPDMLRLCRAVGASRLQVMFAVRLPIALPFIFSAMKIAITLAIIGVIVGEFITSQRGLGYLILFASSRQETALSMAAMVMLCIVGLVLYGAVALAERLMKRWYDG
jgi:NitT/TauT family transport system permease protein